MSRLVARLCCFLLLCGLAGAGSADAPSGRWIQDRARPCRVYTDAVATTVYYQGKCINGLAEGMGELSLYVDRDLRGYYTGFFRRGLYLGEAPVTGEIIDLPNSALFAFAPSRDGVTLYAPMTPRPRISALCGPLLYAVSDNFGRWTPVQKAEMTNNALRAYSAVCQPDVSGQKTTLQVSYMPRGFIARGLQVTPFQTLTAGWDGHFWQMAPVGAGQVAQPGRALDWRAAVTAERRQLAPIAPEGTRLELAVYVTQGLALGFPDCRVNLEIKNTGRLPISRVTVAGMASADGQTAIARFNMARASLLPPAGRVTLRRQLPARACWYIRNLALERLQCAAGNTPVTDCRNAVTVRRVTSLPTEEDVRVVPGIQIHF
jgi:hypothetical protein